MDERLNEFKALGGLLGAKFTDDKEEGKEKPIASDPNVNTQFEFLSPEDYEKMPKEKREELTKKMMNKHKRWANVTALGEEDHATSGT